MSPELKLKLFEQTARSNPEEIVLTCAISMVLSPQYQIERMYI